MAAKQLDPSVPVWSIESVGAVVATRDTFTINDVVLVLGALGTQEIKFRFELDESCCETFGTDARFLDQPDAACDAVGAVPTRVVECSYTRDVVSGQRERFTFRHRITPPAAFGQPMAWMTVVNGEISMRQGLMAQRVAPKSDFVIAVEGPGAGRVGDIVEFTWSVTNVGLDAVWDRSGMFTFAAPAGTEFADSLANTKPDDMVCQTSAILQTLRNCWFPVVRAGQANARKETWRLKILSSQVGEGKVAAQLQNATGRHPEGDFEDPTPANNVAAIRIRFTTTVALPGAPMAPADSAASSELPLSASAAPGETLSEGAAAPSVQSSSVSVAGGGWKLTGSTVGWTAAAALAAVAALLPFLVARRRRSALGDQG